MRPEAVARTVPTLGTLAVETLMVLACGLVAAASPAGAATVAPTATTRATESAPTVSKDAERVPATA